MAVHTKRLAGDILLIVFMLLLYCFVWGRFGQKFAECVSLCFLTGVICRLLTGFLGKQKFCWHLFLFFPLFVPLSLPLQLIPMVLIVAYLATVSAFGGQGKQIFNPTVVAAVIMIASYSMNYPMQTTKPFPELFAGFSIHTSGVAPTKPIWQVYSKITLEELLETSYSGNLPAVPGSAFGLPLFIASALCALIKRTRLVWWLTSVMTVQIVFLTLHKLGNITATCFHPLVLGVLPALLLISVEDESSLPNSKRQQLVYGIIFAAFFSIFTIKSQDFLLPLYALLTAQIIAPLLIDLGLALRTNKNV